MVTGGKHGEIKHGWGSRWKKSDVLFTVDVKVVVMDSVFDEGKVTSERLPWFSAFFKKVSGTV